MNEKKATYSVNGGEFTPPRHISGSSRHRTEIPTATPMFSGVPWSAVYFLSSWAKGLLSYPWKNLSIWKITHLSLDGNKETIWKCSFGLFQQHIGRRVPWCKYASEKEIRTFLLMEIYPFHVERILDVLISQRRNNLASKFQHLGPCFRP